MSYELLLDDSTRNYINGELRQRRTGGLGISLEVLLNKLSETKYRKGGKAFSMFSFCESRPYHKICGKLLPSEIKRACYNCHKVIIPQKIWSKEGVKWLNIYKQELICPECKKKFRNKTLNCPYCNPDDLPRSIYKKKFPDENPEKAYIFPDDSKSLGWTPLKIVFNPDFFDNILKGLELEQQIYNILNSHVAENQIKISTRIKTIPNNDWGVEVDILFADKMQGKVSRS